MVRHLRIPGGVKALVAVLALVAPLSAQQPPASAGMPTEAPTAKSPLRFTAINQAVESAGAVEGVTQITIERWTTDVERTALLALVDTSKAGERGQSKLLDALQKVKPRVGFIRTPNSLGWDLRYAVENTLPDGTRQVVIATDKRVSFAAAAGGSEVLDYPFTLIEMRMKPNQKGEGKMLVAASVTTKNGRLELENYGDAPVRLTQITEEQKKK